MVGQERLVAVAVLFQRLAAFLPKLRRVQRIFGAVGFRIQAAGKIQQTRCDVDVADHRIGLNTATRLIGITHDEGHSQAALVHRGLSAGECHPVVAGKDDQGFVVEPILF